MAQIGTSTGRPRDRTPIRVAAAVVGAGFVLVGLLGFIPGVTTDYDELQFAGHGSEAMLLGLFQVSVLHNLVHLAYGVLGLVAARSLQASRIFLVGGGIGYLVLWAYGVLIDEEADANFVPLNEADDYLHFGLGIGMVFLGVMLWRNPRQPLGE